MYQVWLGRLALRNALRVGSVEFVGAPAVIRRLPSVMELSPVAPLVAPHATA